MSNIYVNVIGNGTAWVDNPTPNNGDIITIYAYLTPPASLLYITMQSEYGYYIAVDTTPVQQIQYDSSWGDCTIKATFTHDIITVNYSAGGYAYVSNPNPSDGDTVTLECIPDFKYEIIDIIATDENGNVIPLIIDIQQTFTYDDSWGVVTIDVTFDMKFIYKNLWLLFRRQWWRKNNY